MSKYTALLNLLKANGLFRGIYKGKQRVKPPENMPKKVVEKRQRETFEIFLGTKILSDPLLKSMMNRAAQELLFNALWEDFKKYELEPEPESEPTKPNLLNKLTPEQALVMGLFGGILGTAVKNMQDKNQ